MNTGVKAVAADLQRIFGTRLRSVVAYKGDDEGDGVHSLALVDSITFSDLAACATRTADWRKAGASAPLILTKDEFLRTLDVFPLEYGGIIANGSYDKVGFAVKLGFKDSNLILAAGQAANVPLPSANVFRDTLLEALAHGEGDLDWAVMARVRARAAGLES